MRNCREIALSLVIQNSGNPQNDALLNFGQQQQKCPSQEMPIYSDLLLEVPRLWGLLSW
jgi:hypothetical protein